MVFFGYKNLSITSSENNVEQECREIESELYSMVSSGVARNLSDIGSDQGTIRSCCMNLPDNLVYLSFGVDPDPKNNGNYQSGLTLNGSCIFYKIDGGSKKVIWLDESFKFREGKLFSDKWFLKGLGQGYIIRGGGKVNLVFELVKKDEELLILIHGNDNIFP